MKELYFNGKHVLKEYHLFAFPRTGSHFLFHILGGLFDLVDTDHPHLRNPEAIDRQNELSPTALYALDLREDGVPFTPIFVNPRATGMHGVPVMGEKPAMLLIRDPVPAVYSAYRTGTERWGLKVADLPAWIEQTLRDYAGFYEAGFRMLAEHPSNTLLVRWEDLVSGPEALRPLVEFIGVRPKLTHEFVHEMTRFDVFVAPGHRTFYRAGTNAGWRADTVWTAALRKVPEMEFSRFGYKSLAAQVSGVQV